MTTPLGRFTQTDPKPVWVSGNVKVVSEEKAAAKAKEEVRNRYG